MHDNNNIPGNAHAKSCSFPRAFGGEKRVENILSDGFRYAWTIIGNGAVDIAAVEPGVNADRSV